MALFGNFLLMTTHFDRLRCDLPRVFQYWFFFAMKVLKTFLSKYYGYFMIYLLNVLFRRWQLILVVSTKLTSTSWYQSWSICFQFIWWHYRLLNFLIYNFFIYLCTVVLCVLPSPPCVVWMSNSHSTKLSIFQVHAKLNWRNSLYRSLNIRRNDTYSW